MSVKGRRFILKEVKKEQTYESAIERLEEIVTLLEGSSLPLEESLRLFAVSYTHLRAHET